jgi:chaperonin cofactor prefoldin
MNEPTPKTLKGMPLRFDYSHVKSEDVLHIKRKTNEVRTLNRNKGTRVCGRDVFAIGAVLIDIGNRMPNELFSAWLETEAQISKDVARKYTIITKKLGYRASKLGNVSVTILYELTLSSYPQPFLDKVLSGTYIPNLEEVRRMRIPPSRAISTDETKSREEIIRDLSNQIEFMKRQIDTLPPSSVLIQEVEKLVVPPDIEKQIAELQEKVQFLAKELDIANEALSEKDKEIEKLYGSIESLSADKNNLLDKYGSTKSKLDRLIMATNQISKEG